MIQFKSYKKAHDGWPSKWLGEQKTSVDFNNTDPFMNHKPNGNTLAPPKFLRFLGRVLHHGGMSSVRINRTCSCFNNNNRKGSASSDGHQQAQEKAHREEGAEEKPTSGPPGEIF